LALNSSVLWRGSNRDLRGNPTSNTTTTFVDLGRGVAGSSYSKSALDLGYSSLPPSRRDSFTVSIFPKLRTLNVRVFRVVVLPLIAAAVFLMLIDAISDKPVHTRLTLSKLWLSVSLF
jgi:hypothetical protein